jgi:hypothetical protein
MDNKDKNDNELLQLLTELWDNTIIPLYKTGKIQTERHLQSYLFMLLKNRFKEKVPKDWDVWVEPQFYFERSHEKMYKPDIVITKGYDIAGILELKFTPQEGKSEKNKEAAEREVDKLEVYYKMQSNFPKREPIADPEPYKTEFLLDLSPSSGAYNKNATPYIRQPGFTQYLFLGIAQYKEIKIKELLCEYAESKLIKEFSCLIHSNC